MNLSFHAQILIIPTTVYSNSNNLIGHVFNTMYKQPCLCINSIYLRHVNTHSYIIIQTYFIFIIRTFFKYNGKVSIFQSLRIPVQGYQKNLVDIFLSLNISVNPSPSFFKIRFLYTRSKYM